MRNLCIIKVFVRMARNMDKMAGSLELRVAHCVQEKLRAAAPAGASVMLYKNMEELKAAFENGKNLQWIQHELSSVPEPGSSPDPATFRPHQ